MNVAEDRVLEHALGEVFEEGPTDLAERVLGRLEELEGRDVGAATGMRRRWLAAAAAAALIAGPLLFFQLFRPDAPPAAVALATSMEPLAVVFEGDFEPRLRSTFDAGATLVNGPEVERELTLASGETVRMGRCSMLTLDRDERGVVLEPRLGSIRVNAPAPSTVRIHTSLGALSLANAGGIRIKMPAEGYDLAHPELFLRFAKEIHMKTALPLVLTAVTVFEGQALLETPSGPRSLEAGATLQDEDAATRAERIQEKLLEEVGTWDLTVTQITPTGERGEPLQGVEICGAGPGDQWLLTDTTISLGARKIETHTIIGFNRLEGAYTGTLIDSFGGEMGLLKGTPASDLDSRTLRMFSAEGTPGFDARATMKWESEDLRRTELTVLQDEEWVLIREIVHRRRQ